MNSLCIRCGEDYVYNDGYLCERCIDHFARLHLFEEAVTDWIYEKADEANMKEKENLE